MEDRHPTLWSLVQDPPDPDVVAHLEQCPKCRVDARLYAKVQATDPEALEGIVQARSALRDVREASIDTLHRLVDADSDEAAHLEPGRVIDRYVVEARVGAGGMATVYRVRHQRLDSLHALKVMHRTTPAERDRLFREGRAQGRLRHPNVVAVTDVVDVGGAPGLIMEYVDGPTLSRYLVQRGAPSLPEVDRLATGILRGVAAAHREGLVHRDLKPANILLAPGDEGRLPKVTDFGLVRSIDPGGTTRLTRTGVPMGTPSYMAPEQLRDASRADARSDVFSLGALLYELATGQRAFQGQHWLDIADRIRTGSYTPPGSVVPELPERMTQTIERCLEVDPDARFADCEAVLEAWASGAASGPDPAAPGERRWWSWAAAAVGGSALFLVVLAVGVTAGWFAGTVEDSSRNLPWTTDDPQTRATFGSGWTRFLDDDPRGAATFFDRVRKHSPKAILPRVLLGVSEDLQGGRGQAMEALDKAVQLAGDDPGRDATLARLVEQRLYGASSDDEWDALLAAYPTDYLVSLLDAWRIPRYSGAAERLTARTVALRPDAAIGYVVRARTLRARGDLAGFRETLSLLQQRTTWRPEQDWELWVDSGRMSAQEREIGKPWHAPSLTAADQSLQAILRSHPDATDVRYAYAGQLAEQGDEAGSREELERVFAETTPVLDRIRLARRDARREVGWGHFGEARARLKQCWVDAQVSDMPAEVVLCIDARVKLALLVGDPDELTDAMASLKKVRDAPGVPQELENRMTAGELYLDGRLALMQGDFKRAWHDAEVIRAWTGLPVWWLDGAAAADDLSSRANPMERAGVPLPASEVDAVSTGARSCRREAAWSRILHGQPASGQLLEALAGAVAPCRPWEDERYLIARGDVALAEAALGPKVGDTSKMAMGLLGLLDVDPAKFPDPQAAARMLDDYHALWPDPDPDLPLVARARAVEAALAESPE